jgi:hypothetical protein
MGIVVFAIVVAVIALVFAPLGLIWAVNTLFGTGIAYALNTWFAALLLGALFSSSSATRKSK